ncbi:MAG: ABC transporter permease [Deltaproteobacteria bacterium]|nr:ABC transporter permease [Deltaproteobacteria bacterium]MBI3076952.1 ABC transporter permease [Deltaproteobacteria bacterium]
MARYVAHRLLLLVPVLLGVAFVTFLTLHLTPGDPAQIMLGERATPEAVAALRERLGLDRPFATQFLRYLGRLATGDLGRSIQTNNEVLGELGLKFPATIELALFAMGVAIVLGVAAGALSASRPATLWDYLGTIGSTVGIAMPVFWLGLLLMLLFSALLGWLPFSGRLSPASDLQRVTHFYLLDSLLTGNLRAFGDSLRHLLLPGLTLATVPTAFIARMTRAALLEALGGEYIRTARAKGLSEPVVLLRHALRNALVPVLTITGLQFGTLLGGAVLTESIFAWPGLGRLTVDAIFARDYPLVQGCLLLFALTFVLLNLLTDLLYVRADPRIRYRPEPA